VTRRNVIYIQPAPRAGILTWTLVMLVYVGIVLPLVAVWLVLKHSVLAIFWAICQIRAGEEARRLSWGEL